MNYKVGDIVVITEEIKPKPTPEPFSLIQICFVTSVKNKSLWG